ncbi:MAG: FtsW/RodA/SpoVE family cell cycle protein [Bacteroidales bacterium]|nr:FtsW/RodA/SpoVE family cell cycle protein [Bacteroidales bacterium]MBN2756849.1 FtsW/RodA/SpoVE family cell cycle protein [Bacteroidales bacterium]
MKEILSKYFQGDKRIWAVIVFLTIISLVSVYSSIGNLAFNKGINNTSSIILNHITFIIVGYILIIFLHKISYKVYFSLSQVFIVLVILLLLYTLIKGTDNNDAKRWVNIFGFGIQASDFAKFGLILYIARILSMHQESEESLNIAYKNLIWPIIIITALIFPENISTAALLFLSSLILMFIGRIPIKTLLKFIGIMMAILTFAVLIALVTPYKGRVLTGISRFKNFQSEDIRINQQTITAKSAIASSGIIGKGPGNSSVKYILSSGHSDFIFAIIIEELGSLIAILVLASYLFIFYRVGVIAKESSMTFPALLAIGLSLNLVIQAFTNMMVAVNLFPVTGQTLPLISKGGTSMLTTFASLAIILNISKEIQNNKNNEIEINEETGLAEDSSIYL